MRNSENIRNADLLDFDWMGFIFYPESKRHVAQMPSYMPQRKKKIGVFVNATIEEIVHKQRNKRINQQAFELSVYFHQSRPNNLNLARRHISRILRTRNRV